VYDRHELKIIRRGVSIDKVIAAYKHFGSLRKAAAVCHISKDTVKAVLRRYNVEGVSASLPKKASYNPRTHYSTFAKWHQAHVDDPGLPYSRSELAKLAGVSVEVVHCYFYRRRKDARKLLASLPDLRDLDIPLQDIEGVNFKSYELSHYRYAIDRYARRAAIQGSIELTGEVTILIPSIELFARRVMRLSESVDPGLPKSRLPSGKRPTRSRPQDPLSPETPAQPVEQEA